MQSLLPGSNLVGREVWIDDAVGISELLCCRSYEDGDRDHVQYSMDFFVRHTSHWSTRAFLEAYSGVLARR